ncbi:LOW QUALITY PROTEIN: hypothetical protein M8C21_007692, partial [Ambrosia artemisiifolia]
SATRVSCFASLILRWLWFGFVFRQWRWFGVVLGVGVTEAVFSVVMGSYVRLNDGFSTKIPLLITSATAGHYRRRRLVSPPPPRRRWGSSFIWEILNMITFRSIIWEAFEGVYGHIIYEEWTNRFEHNLYNSYMSFSSYGCNIKYTLIVDIGQVVKGGVELDNEDTNKLRFQPPSQNLPLDIATVAKPLLYSPLQAFKTTLSKRQSSRAVIVGPVFPVIKLVECNAKEINASLPFEPHNQNLSNNREYFEAVAPSLVEKWHQPVTVNINSNLHLMPLALQILRRKR